MVLGDLNGLLEGKGVFHKGGNKTRDNMPFDVTMEQPNT
jgi:hypothetical protein